jgi:type IX secretion system PorP/SprF family membrane protein
MEKDPHYSNNRAVSNYFNPAQTGDFAGTWKLHMSIRTQYQRVFENGVAGVEMNINSPLSNKHWIGVGANMLYDKMGSLAFKSTGGTINLGYHMFLDKKKKSSVSLGGGIGSLTMGLDASNYRSELTLLGMTDIDKMPVSDFNGRINTMQLGLLYKSTLDKKNRMSLGVALMHLNAPKFNIVTNKDVGMGRRVNIQASLITQVKKLISIEPGVYLSFSEHQSNLNLQVHSEWKLTKDASWSGVTGLYHRLGESIGLTVGYKSDKTYIAFNFDILTGKVGQVLNNFGAMELGGYHIINKYVKPVVKPIFFCPRI